MEKRALVIIGSGPAGYSAAIYTARAMLNPLMFSGLEPGGQLTITTDVENYPGYIDPVQGPWVMEQMKGQAERVGTEILNDVITEADFSKRPFRLKSDAGKEVLADAVIIATGAQARWLGLESETKFQGFGVSACATCDGFFFREKEVLVVGGGNTAVEEALFLTRFAKRVRVIHRRDSFRAEKIMQDRLFANPKIEVIWNSELEEILGSDEPRKTTGAKLKNRESGEITEVEADGIFIAIGHKPATEVFGDQLKMKKNSGCIWTEPGTTRTSIAGVYAAGDVADDLYRQAVTAAGLGCMAALEAEHDFAAASGD